MISSLDLKGLPNVSCETMERLRTYQSLLLRWQQTINLVSERTLPDIWDRHFRDSAQLLIHIRKDSTYWLDLGSGAGFPGLVCAIIAAEIYPHLKFGLIESDARKCSFMNEVLRQTATKAIVFNQRIENVSNQRADIVSARALAPLHRSLIFATQHLATGGTCLFPKGIRFKEELAMIQTTWQINFDVIPSQTCAESVILKFTDICHA